MSTAGAAFASSATAERTAARLGHLLPQSRGVRNLCWHTGDRAARRPGRRGLERVARLEGGGRLVVDLAEHAFRQMYFHGTYEPDVTRVVRHLAGPGQVWLDVGANAGFYTVLLSRLLGPTGSVHAFEPNPAMAARLRRSLALNGADNVTLHELAVSDATGTATLFVPRPGAGGEEVDGGSGRGSLIRQTDVADAEAVEVPQVRLDDVLSALPGRVDCMKIDVEGFELAAFRGMAATLADRPPRVILSEVSFFPDCLCRPAELIAHLCGWGYDAYRIRDDGLHRYRAGDRLDGRSDKDFAFVQDSARDRITMLVWSD